MLNYKNDSLLLESETSNDLIRNKNTHLIFLDKGRKQLNLFSAFVKKADFIGKDRKNQPLQTTVYVKVTNHLRDIIDKRFPNKKEIIKLLERYIDRRTNIKNSISKWFNRQVFPFILLRIMSKDNQEFSGFIKEIEYFTDFLNKSRFYSPKILDELLDKKTVYLVGCSIGDGHINKKGKRWTLVDGSSKKERLILSKKFILSLSKLLKKFITNYEIQEYNTKYVLRVNNKIFCRFLNFFFGLPFGKKKEAILRNPLILNFSKEDLEKYFWRGCFDTDGSVNVKGAVDFCSSDENLLKECEYYLKTKGIIIKRGRLLVRINCSSLKKFEDIGFAHPRKQKEYLSILKRKSRYKTTYVKDHNKIDKRLLQIYGLLRVDNNYRIRIHSRNLKDSKFNESDVNKIIKGLFSYELKRTRGLLYFKSKKAHEYLNKHLLFESYWKPINTKEETILLNMWNNVWRLK